MKKKTLLIAGGGTGGHVLAGIAVAEAWKDLNRDVADVVFIGAQGGLEESLVPTAGFPLYLLKLGSLNRVSFGRRFRTLFQLPFAFFRSVFILLKYRPSVTLGVGGYASGPVLVSSVALGWLWRGKSAILEQNSIPGMTNRILGRITELVFLAFPSASDHFQNATTHVTGNPIRSQFSLLQPGKTDPFTVFIFGGSQGAVGVNNLVLDSLQYLKEFFPRLRFIHQSGAVDFQRVSGAHQEAGSGARVERFIRDMKSAYSEASLLICRAGSSSLSELAAVGRAAILVPLPTAADDHQEKNARVFAGHGAAFLLNQRNSTGEDLAKMVRDLIDSPERIHEMERKVRCFYKPDAARDIVRILNGST